MVDVADVGADGFGGDAEGVGNVLVTPTRGEYVEDLLLADGEGADGELRSYADLECLQDLAGNGTANG